MNTKKIVAAVVLADFAALNAYAFYTSGVSGFVDYVTTIDNPWAYVLGVDLVIALGMIVTWMLMDAKRNGRNALGHTVLTLALGSVGPLLYLVTAKPGDAGAQ